MLLLQIEIYIHKKDLFTKNGIFTQEITHCDIWQNGRICSYIYKSYNMKEGLKRCYCLRSRLSRRFFIYIKVARKPKHSLL